MQFDMIASVVQAAANPLVKGLVSVAIEAVGDLVKANMPLPDPRETGQSSLLLTPTEKRISVGLTKCDGQVVMALLVEKPESAAERVAEEISDRGGEAVVHVVTGTAHSSKTDVGTPQNGRKGVGGSIGHINGYPGTVGCLVEISTNGESYTAITSAAHVLSMMNQAGIGDSVIMPGHPDGPKVLKNVVGTLDNFNFLSHYTDDQNWANIINHEDIAVVKLHRPAEWEDGNLILNPSVGTKKCVREVVTKEQILDYVGHKVYKCGRTTDLTSGVLEVIAIEQFAIRLPDGRNYMYKDLIAIKGDKGNPFSLPGDSGALVYTQDHKALGFIVGGSETYTFACFAQRCLQSMSAKII